MWIVRLALRRPYTFVVMAMLLVLGGVFAITKMPTDIFPEIDIPVVAVVWQYGGLPAEEMERRVTTNYERAITTTVSGVEHIESQTLAGYGIVKVFFHPGTRIEAATAQITAISQTVVRQFPPGMTPPLIMQYSASNVPIVQGAVGSDTLPEQALFDLTNTGLRTGLATVQGAQMPFPYGGKMRQIMVDIDLARLHALGLAPNDVASAISLQNLVLPSGTVKLGAQELGVRLNSSPETLRELSGIPIATVRGATVTIGDVAQVRDGFAPQTNMVRNNGRNGVLLSVLKSGGASTLDIVRRIRGALPQVLPTLPPEYHLDLLFDQSIFVRAAVDGVVKEGITAAALTAVMILLFLGSWRSTLIVLVSIPLSILASVIVLAALGQTLNLMTLGGLSLAVGILVDDATVEIENVHRNIAMRKPLVRAILDGAQQIATPAFVATLSICIVFVPVVFITGAARSLFTPLAMAVAFAMMTSYLLSRTLVPTMMQHLLGAELHRYTGDPSPLREDLIWRAHQRFNRLFERLRRAYGGYLDVALDHRALVSLGFGAFVLASALGLYPHLGRDFFPAVDAGQIRMHVRCPPGMRLEETARQFSLVEEEIRRVIPREEIVTLLDNIGVPNSGINLALGDPSMISAADGEIMVALDPHRHGPTAGYVKTLRERFAERFPTFEIFFLAPDITTQVLNFGLSAPIDIQVSGPPSNRAENLRVAQRLRDQLARVPGAVDVHLQQVLGAPSLRLDVDRVRASQQGLTERDVANSVLVSLSSNSAVAPSFWLDPRRGVQYQVAVQTPQYRVDSLDALRNTPVLGPGGGAAQTLGNLATVERGAQPVNITHYNVAPTYDVLASVQGTDLGAVADAVDRILARERRHLPRGTTITVRGQVESMASSFRGLAYGIVFAIALVYLLLVVNFQSWLDPVIILGALPGALAGICWMLFASHTTLSVPALMGAIMSIGVATSNSILMVTFANDQRAEGADARRAAWLAGITRLRPVLMTALAMVLGMLPMSLGMGEGGEQNAPLGRAVIGGLCLATVATLFFVPVLYSVLRRSPPKAPIAELET
ncbi:MAG: efflux RND transporter permease subunit [Deltaproteobacteria bacterium]|nr:efflux RND transporter permease subunit [Deltaproteobacteria bacterium]